MTPTYAHTTLLYQGKALDSEAGLYYIIIPDGIPQKSVYLQSRALKINLSYTN